MIHQMIPKETPNVLGNVQMDGTNPVMIASLARQIRPPMAQVVSVSMIANALVAITWAAVFVAHVRQIPPPDARAAQPPQRFNANRAIQKMYHPMVWSHAHDVRQIQH